MQRQCRVQPLGERRQTRQSDKMAATSIAAARPVAFADQRNVQNNVAAKKVLMTKQDAKKLQTVGISKGEDFKKPPCKAGVSKVPAATETRFEDVVIRCQQFSDDVTNYLFFAEKKFGVEEGFLHGRDVTPKMRSILADWLVQVHQRFDLHIETLYGTFNLLDRYLSCGHADKTNLQLVGVSCMSLAAKYEEIYPPELQDFVYITENAFTKRDIIRMEIKVLMTIHIDLGRPTVIQFVRRLTEYFDPKVHALTKYISEVAVSCYSICHLNPSVIAAVSLWIAVQLEQRSFAAAYYRIARVSKETVHELAPRFASNLMKMQTNTKLKAVRSKYESSKHLRVSCFTESQIQILQKLEDASYVATLH